MYPLLALCLFALRAAAQDECAACTDADCAIIESVKIGEACVDELCVAGAPVAGGDNDACTREELVDGVLVSVRIKDCCRAESNDCADFLPSSCHVSECVLAAEGDTHGYCRHERVLGCCACDQDCPERPCFEAQCVAASPQHAATLLKFSEQEPTRMTPANSVSETAAGKMCEYTPIEDCCLRSTGAPADGGEEDGFSCDSRAPEGTFGICDKNCECQFIPTLEIECRTNEDCRVDEEEDGGEGGEEPPAEEGGESLESLWRRTQPGDRAPKRSAHKKKKYHRRKSGPCIAPVCSPQGLCIEEFDSLFDGDADGVTCVLDCDDQDPAKGAFTYCAEGGDEYNADGDAFAKCGAPVERLCLEGDAPACPEPEQLVVAREDVVQSVHNAKLLVLRYNCDCCDDFDGLDEPALCARDADGEGTFACGTNSAACVPQRDGGTAPPPLKPHKDDEHEHEHDWHKYKAPWHHDSATPPPFDPAAADAACQAWAAAEELDDPEQFIAISSDELEEQCDECDNNPDLLLAETTCFWDGDGDDSAHCSADVASLEECCAQILDLSTAPTPLINFCVCLNEDGADADSCAADDDNQIPILFDQCFCPPDFSDDPGETIDECGEDASGQEIVRCYKDVDQDCFANCEQPQDICVPTELAPEEACKERGEIYLGDEPVSLPDPRCDCNDKNFKERQLVACLRDEDQDGFVGAECAEKCSIDDKCPEGYKPLSDFGGEAQRKRAGTPRLPPFSPQLRRLQKLTGATTATVRNVEHLLNKRHAPWKHYNKAKCDPLPANEHQQCPDEPQLIELIGAETIDCCDKDKYAYPDSPYFLYEPTKCADDDFDFNCNGTPEKAYQCSTEQPTLDDSGRSIFTTSDDELLFEFTEVGTLGHCGSDGTPLFGWLPESAAPANRKRQSTTIATPFGCNADTITDVVVDSDTNLFVTSPATGQCATAVVGCVEQNDKWHEDCEICIATEQ